MNTIHQFIVRNTSRTVQVVVWGPSAHEAARMVWHLVDKRHHLIATAV